MRNPGRISAAAVALFLLSISMQAQGNSLLAAFRQAGIPEAPGAIPVFYVESEKERALGFQKSLQAAHDWYQKQLNVSVSIVLTVFDAATYAQFKLTNSTGTFLTPRNGDPYIVQMPGNDGADTSGHPLGALQGEPVLFHEYGHILATHLGIGSRLDSPVEELTANMFRSAYLQSERRDLYDFIESRRAADMVPRYTALIDYDYIGSALDVASRGWLQRQMSSIANAVTKNQRLSDLVQKLVKEFPRSSTRFETIDSIAAGLSRISVAFQPASFAAAFRPSAIAAAAPVGCDSARPPGDRSGRLIIANTTANPITLSPINDPKGSTVTLTIPLNEYRSLTRQAGLVLKISDGSCYVLREEPTVATIGGR